MSQSTHSLSSTHQLTSTALRTTTSARRSRRARSRPPCASCSPVSWRSTPCRRAPRPSPSIPRRNKRASFTRERRFVSHSPHPQRTQRPSSGPPHITERGFSHFCCIISPLYTFSQMKATNDNTSERERSTMHTSRFFGLHRCQLTLRAYEVECVAIFIRSASTGYNEFEWLFIQYSHFRKCRMCMLNCLYDANNCRCGGCVSTTRALLQHSAMCLQLALRNSFTQNHNSHHE